MEWPTLQWQHQQRAEGGDRPSDAPLIRVTRTGTSRPGINLVGIMTSAGVFSGEIDLREEAPLNN